MQPIDYEKLRVDVSPYLAAIALPFIRFQEEVERLASSNKMQEAVKRLAELQKQAEDERWRTDPLNLMPLFSVPQLAVARGFRLAADGLYAIADWIEP